MSRVKCLRPFTLIPLFRSSWTYYSINILLLIMDSIHTLLLELYPFSLLLGLIFALIFTTTHDLINSPGEQSQPTANSKQLAFHLLIESARLVAGFEDSRVLGGPAKSAQHSNFNCLINGVQDFYNFLAALAAKHCDKRS